MSGSIIFENADCMEKMRGYPDKYFDLAIVDPPYYKEAGRRTFYGRDVSPIGVKRTYPKMPKDCWNIPDEEYFTELFRISKEQIIWGCNYFDYHFGPGRIVWDKCNSNTPFSDCEIAYCSMHDSVRLFRYMWNGMCQGKSLSEGHIMQGNKALNEARIHPYQKPVAIYTWQLQKYAKKGYRILDTHAGSASLAVACYRMPELQLEYTGFEKDTQFFTAAKKRLNEEMSQIRWELQEAFI